MKYKTLLFSILFLSAALFYAKNAAAAAPTGYSLTFSDEFVGSSLDSAKWNYRNAVVQKSYSKPANVSVAGGYLNIACKKESDHGVSYTTGGIISKEQFGYGYYEASIKYPNGAGWHGSFWLSNQNAADDGGGWQEIDIIEADTDNLYEYKPNYHCWYAKAAGKHYQAQPSLGGVASSDLSASFHTFGCLFTPYGTFFYLDDKLVKQVDNSAYTENTAAIFLTTVVVNSASYVDETGLPKYFSVDWIKYYAPPENHITNPNFELNASGKPAGWNDAGSVGNYFVQQAGGTSAVAKTYKTQFAIGNTTELTSAAQNVTGLENGLYTLRCMTKLAAGSEARISASDFGGTPLSAPFEVNGSWKMLQINDIAVTNGQLKVIVSGKNKDGISENGWIRMDAVELVKQSAVVNRDNPIITSGTTKSVSLTLDPKSTIYAGNINFYTASYLNGQMRDLASSSYLFGSGGQNTLINSLEAPAGSTIKSFLWSKNMKPL